MVTEQELKDLLSLHHWTLGRGRTGKQQVFSAKRHTKEGSTTRYIGTEQRLKDMTRAEVLEKLRRPAKARPAKS